MGLVLPAGTERLNAGRARYVCSRCELPFEGPAIQFGDGVWAVVSAVYCSPGCFGDAAGLAPIPAGKV